MGELHVVVGGQYGSEGKGAVAGYLTREAEFGNGMAIRVAGPNAGHSAVGTDGVRYALRQLPVAAVTNPNALLGIAAGSEIDLQVLQDEIKLLENAGFGIWARLVIDPSATMIDPDDSVLEREVGLVDTIGSTGKGIGAARSNRIWRRARLARDVPELTTWGTIAYVASIAQATLRRGDSVLVEGTQGYGLGLHTDNYPQVTSSDCRAIDFLAMAGLSPWSPVVTRFRIWVCYRPYPIRVAGNSGPLREETTWDGLGLPEEKTTVTQKIRRVGQWDPDLAHAAAVANGGPHSPARAVLTMADQVVPEVAGQVGGHRHAGLANWIVRVEADSGLPVELVGTGPGTMLDLRRDLV